MRIYLDNAATTPLCPDVLEAMLPYLRNNFGNPSSTHQEGRTARAAIETSRKIIARVLGAAPSEIIFTSGGTEASNIAIKCAVRDLGVQRIISSSIEHPCVFNTANNLEAKGIDIQHVKIDQYGRANLEHLAELLANSEKKTLVSLMHANNEIGTLNPIDKIARLCEEYNAYFHTDTVQTIGHLPVDISSTNISFLTGSAHKLYGPKGIGFLYINKNNNIGSYADGGGQERKIRSGTENVASIVGLGKALSEAIKHLTERRQHIEKLRNHLVTELENHYPSIKFNGDYKGQCLFKTLNVSFKTETAINILLFKLDLKGISVSGGAACNSGAVKGSRVLGELNIPKGYQSIRFSFSHFNTKEEIDFSIVQLKEIIK
jgi:cysteine desulfurase